ncbi:response regulator [Vibrio sp. JC009]|uniref:response regulator n=1 Tax=Vibrio sp. JC009 TaxID=2912314 RepID=UPI0023B0701D|nr:response regulator [Vibrio sp. JC009]WED22309.1 response regulator [Vibrio sp. JC009]
MRILLVEDNHLLSHHVSSQLSEAGHIVVTENTASAGLQTIRKQGFDIGIIDIGLPDFDGIRLIKQIRRDGLAIPLITLTARSSWQEKVEGLEAGADDYMVKPFQMEELIARLYALVRRSAGFSSQNLNVGNIELNLNDKSVFANGQALILTSTEYSVIECLVKNHDRIISKQKLIEYIYPPEEISESQLNTIEVMVSRVRKKLAETGTSGAISTVRGRGYILKVE